MSLLCEIWRSSQWSLYRLGAYGSVYCHDLHHCVVAEGENKLRKISAGWQPILIDHVQLQYNVIMISEKNYQLATKEWV